MAARKQETILGRDDIVAADDLRTESVPVPEWGGAVIVSEMTSGDRDRWESELVDIKKDGGRENATAWLLSYCLVDADGNRLFGKDDIPALAKKSALALNRVYRVAARINGLTAAELEQAEGN